MIRVLVVDDSPTFRLWLTEILQSDPSLQVIGTANNGEEGVKKALALKPDLITMDLHMPVMDGVEATQRIMQEVPTPIVVISSAVEAATSLTTFNAIQAGALELIEKPAGLNHPDFEQIRERLVTTVKLMAEVKVFRHRLRKLGPTQPLAPAVLPQPRNPAVLAIGASTGGPGALNRLLKLLPAEFPLPILIVQHMTIGFTEGLVKWLQTESRLTLNIAQNRQRIQPGAVYFAPDDQHMELLSREVVGLNQRPQVSHVRPSATVLFESVAQVFGSDAVGVLLTGMGDDGASGLKSMRNRGGLTIVQDEATSVVYGMPQAAAALDAADHILPLDQIGSTLLTLIQKHTKITTGD